MLNPFGGLKKVFGGVNKAVKKVGSSAFGAVDRGVRAATPLPNRKKSVIGPTAPTATSTPTATRSVVNSDTMGKMKNAMSRTSKRGM